VGHFTTHFPKIGNRKSKIVMRSASSRTALPLLAVFIVCALASATIWAGAGILNTRAGGDSPFLLIRAHELAANLRAGVFPARWMPDAAYGLGYPFFNFYASLPFHIAALLNVAGVDLIVAIKLTQTLGMFAAGGAMGLFARRMLSPWGSALAACAYVLAPFHLVNVYVRGDSLSEFWAFVWFPLILWAVGETIETRGGKAAILLALSLAGLVLTHNVSAVLFAPFIVIYALALLIQCARSTPQPLPEGREFSLPSPMGRGWGWGFAASHFLRGAMALAIPALAALALSAWFWLPALGEAGGAQLGEQTTGYFNYANHFRSANLVQSSPAFDYAVNENGDAFAMGLVQTMLIVLGSAVWLVKDARAKIQNQKSKIASLFYPVLLLALFALSTFMITPASAFVWEHAPLIKLAQFPWRMLSVQAVFAAVLIGGISTLEKPDPRSGVNQSLSFGLATPFFLLVLIVSALAQLPHARLNVQSRDVTPASIQFYEWFTGNIGTTIRAEYLPQTALPMPRTGPALLGLPPRLFIAQEGVPASALASQLQAQSPAQQTWRVLAAQPMTVAVPLIDTPAWQAQLNGSAIALAPHAGSGWASAPVPAGEHTLTLVYAGTPLQQAGNALSLVTLVVWMGIAAFMLLRAEPAQRRRALPIAGISVVPAMALWLIGLVLGPAQSVPALQTLDFNTRPFPHRDPVIFSNSGARYELTGARTEPAQVRAGEPFTLTLQWRDDRAPSAITVTQELPSGGEFMALFRHARTQIAGDPRLSTHIAITDALRGPLLLRVQASDAEGQPLDAFNPDGTPVVAGIAGKPAPAITLIGPTIIGTPQTDAEITASFSNGIALHRFDWFYASSQDVCFRPQWSLGGSEVNRADALQVSLRLRGSDGRMIAQADSQPQGGLAPTWSWQPGVLIYDSQCVPVQGLLDAGEPYTMQVVWYRAATLQQVSELTLRGARGPALEDLNVPAP
jgi:hypothetical protein